MPKFALRPVEDEEFLESPMLLDKEFDDEAILTQPQGILFLLTDDPQHFNVT